MKSIFENTAPAYLHSSIYFLWLRWLGLWLMLLSVATGARLGNSLRRDRLILWSQAADSEPRWESLCCQTTEHCTLYTALYCTLYTVQWQFIDCSISAELCRPCSSLTRWHCSAACLSLVTSHSYRLLISQHVFFQNLMELCINAKKLQKQGPISEKWHMENKWPSVWMDKFSDQWNDLSFRKHHWQIVYADKHERIEELLNISMIKIHIWCIEFMNFNKELFR